MHPAPDDSDDSCYYSSDAEDGNEEGAPAAGDVEIQLLADGSTFTSKAYRLRKVALTSEDDFWKDHPVRAWVHAFRPLFAQARSFLLLLPLTALCFMLGVML